MLAGCLVLGAYCLGLSFPCPFLRLTGWRCPLCGSTRAALSLLKGDISQAFAYNQLLCLGTVLWLLWLVGLKFCPDKLPKLKQNTWYVFIGVIALVFTVIRNF
uniref:DUF2752 domain-containing protein n=1 Tax=Vaginimicrobium propionicum TaxID=1871034 RepID=UPI0038CD33FE